MKHFGSINVMWKNHVYSGYFYTIFQRESVNNPVFEKRPENHILDLNFPMLSVVFCSNLGIPRNVAAARIVRYTCPWRKEVELLKFCMTF